MRCYAKVSGEFDFGLFGGTARHTPFRNVLLAGAGCLHHLVDGSILGREKLRCEVEGDIVDDACHLVSPQLLIAPAIGEKCMRIHMGICLCLCLGQR